MPMLYKLFQNDVWMISFEYFQNQEYRNYYFSKISQIKYLKSQ